jgi:hypothetical protein
LVVSLLPQRVVLVEEPADRGHGVVPASLEDFYDVSPGHDHDRVAILADLVVGLRVDVGGRDQDAELAVSEPGDEATGPADADTVRRLVTLRFQRKLDRDRIFPGAQEIVTHGVPAAITPGTGDVWL